VIEESSGIGRVVLLLRKVSLQCGGAAEQSVYEWTINLGGPVIATR
jgi:hypothetical protein